MEGFGCLSLVTDAHSRYVVGRCFHETLDTDGPLAALEMAVGCYEAFGIALGSGTVHHSDRGVQYTSSACVRALEGMGVRISMTQTGDPLHNAMAERVNNTVKNEWMFNTGELPFLAAAASMDNAVTMYNRARPHQGIGMKTPYEMMTGKADNPLLAKKTTAGCKLFQGL